MPSKYQYIHELWLEQSQHIVSSPTHWMSFLKTASWTFKYRFEDQILIYAQKPEAKACADYDTWNDKMNRWIKKNSKGIALLNNSGHGLRYVFDISDTRSPTNRPLKLWEIKEENYQEVIEMIENKYGPFTNNHDFGEVLINMAEIIAQDNCQDYVSSLIKYNRDSGFEFLEEHEIRSEFESIVSKSIGFELLNRCGLDPMQYFDEQDFYSISNFNTLDTIGQLGITCHDLCEMAMYDISAKAREIMIRTFANQSQINQNISVENERSNLYETNHLQSDRRLPNAEFDGERTNPQQPLRTIEIPISHEQSSGTPIRIESKEQTQSALDGNREPSTSENGNVDERVIVETPSTEQRKQSDGMGTTHEQSEGNSQREYSQGDHLQLDLGFNVEESSGKEEKNLPPFNLHYLPTLLCEDIGLTKKKEETVQYFREHTNDDERANFLSECYDDTLVQTFKAPHNYDYNYVGYKKNGNGLDIWEGNYLRKESDSFLSFMILQEEVAKLIESGEYLLPKWEKMSGVQQAYKMNILNSNAIFHLLTYRNELLKTSTEIISFFQEHTDEKEQATFIKECFPDHAVEWKVDGVPLGFIKEEDSLHLYFGTYDNQEENVNYSWGLVANFVEGFIVSRYYDPTVQIPTEEEQRNAIFENEESLKNGIFFSQEEIDRILVRGSQVHEGKYRIYQQFQKHSTLKENVDFLKKEYGIGGSNPAYGCIDEWHDGKGITISRKKEIGKEEIKVTLKWDKVAKRIGELIAANRYLSKQELEHYSIYLQEQMNRELEYERQRKEKEFNQDVDGEHISTNTKIQEDIPKDYQWKIGDTIYIGISEYEVIEDGAEVLLQDKEFPLFTENYTADELRRVLKENPLNDKLLVPIQTKTNQPKERTQEELYQEYLPVFVDKIKHSSIYPALRDRDTSVDEAEQMIQSEMIGIIGSMNAEHREIYELYTGNTEIRNSMIDDLIEQTYEDSVVFTKPDNNMPYTKLLLYCEENGYQLPNDYRSNEEIRVLNEVLSYLKIDDIEVSWDEAYEQVIAADEDNTWHGKEFYDFLLNEAIIYDSEDMPNIIPLNVYEHLKDFASIQKVPEIKELLKIDYHITDEHLGAGTPKERYRNNIAAIRLLFSLEKEHRNATKEEQDILSKYVGWGGLADVFDDTKPNWSNEYHELKNLLNEDEYRNARESTLTAFYTPPVVIESIYQILHNVGFRYGNILEPACGTGNFMGLVPESMKDSKLYGIELDSITGRIAKQLYQNANINIEGYEDTHLPDSFFDVAVGNVPFGQFGVMDKRYDKYHFNIHDYFFAKTLDKVRPGGVIAFITSRFTMDKANSSVRKYISERAELLGAIRLPNNTFSESANTKAVSDILVLQKRDRPMIVDEEWLHTEKDSQGNVMNSYYISHPDMILGHVEKSKNMYGREDLTVTPYEDVTLKEALDDAVQLIHGRMENIIIYDLQLDTNDNEMMTIPADPNVRNYSYTIVDGEVYFRKNSQMVKLELSKTAKNRIIGLIDIRECVRRLIDYQKEDYPESMIVAEQQKLNILYDNLTKEYGLINSRGNSLAFHDDSAYYLLCSLENLNEDGTLKSKADMFTKRTIRKKEVVKSVETSQEALMLSLAEKATIDFDYMSSLTGFDKDKMIEDLHGVIYKIPNVNEPSIEEYVTADEYLSGNIREKLKIAKMSALIDPQYQDHVDALTKAMPKDLSASEIEVRLGATWIDPEIYEAFMFELLSTSSFAKNHIQITYSKFTDSWNVSNKTGIEEMPKVKRHMVHIVPMLIVY